MDKFDMRRTKTHNTQIESQRLQTDGTTVGQQEGK